MMKKIVPIILFFAFLLSTGSVMAQDYDKLREEITKKQQQTRERISELNSQIQKYEQRLEQANQKYESLYKNYQNLKNLIALRDNKIDNLESELANLNDEIEITRKSIQQKKEELNRLVENYKETLSYLYKHGRTSQLALVLSSSSINQMLVRSFYLKKFNDYREKQAQQIREKEQELENTRNQLVQARSENEKVLAEIRKEKEELREKRRQQEKNVALLRENKEQIQMSLSKKRQELQNIESILASYNKREQEIIDAQRQAELEKRENERQENLANAKKIEDDAKRAKEVAKYSKPIDRSTIMSDERLKQMETSFAQDKGNLPWPVDSRTISEHFGRRRHPVYGTVTQNVGIEIVTDAAAPVSVVHDGFVIDVRPVPGYGDVVFVKHGRFITAYGNLSEIQTQENAVLAKGETIGLSGVPESTRGESVFFLIRENNQTLDPEDWLRMERVSSLE